VYCYPKGKGIIPMMNISLDKIKSVYSGKLHACCCGCSGKHTYNSRFITESSKSRGYLVEDTEVNDRTVKMIVNKLSKSPDTTEHDYGFVLETPTRLYIAYKSEYYFKKG
jgi:hypothetical protein